MAEFVSASKHYLMSTYVVNVLSELGMLQDKFLPITLKLDCSPAADWAKSGKSKYVALRYLYLKDAVSRNHITIEHTSSKTQRADGMTKTFGKNEMKRIQSHLNMIPSQGSALK